MVPTDPQEALYRPDWLGKEHVATKRETAYETIENILRSGKRQLNTSVNVNLGTAVSPVGIGLMASGSYYLPMILTIAAPQWHLPEERLGNTSAACAGLDHPEICQRILDPQFARRDCPYAVDIEAHTSKIKKSIVDQYAGAATPEYLKLLFSKVCSLYQGSQVCQHASKVMADKSPDGLPRNKRALVGLIIGILGMATGGTALMMAQKNQEQLGAIIETMNTVSKNMEKVVLDFEVLREGVIALAADRNSTTLYTNQHLRTVYSIVERARCVDRAKFSALEQGLAIHIYRTYLTDVMHHVMQAALTGKLTPSLLGMQLYKQRYDRTRPFRTH